jgi:hypothetical protein
LILEMLRRDGVDQRHGFTEVADQNDGAEITPRGAGDRRARQRGELRHHRPLDLVRERSGDR